tara:strand:- start:111 stop:440 length:330 start_codon:yes stop_codon:yes gene_type:complete
MSKFSEAAGLPTTTHESGSAGTTAPPVPTAPPETVAPPTPPVYENPLDDMPVATAPEVPPTAADIPKDLKWMSKIKLEQIGRSLGIELDRRLSQPKLVEQLESHIANIQ